MYTTPDAVLSPKGQRVFKGVDKSNGIMLMGDSVPHIETSCSEIVVGAGLTTAGLGYVPFGNAVWYDESSVPAKDYATVFGARPLNGHLAGIVKYEQGVATGFPMQLKASYGGIKQFGIAPWMKITIIRKGFVFYKEFFASVAAANGTSPALMPFADVRRDMCMFASNTTGFPVLAAPTSISNGVPVLSGATFIGTIEQIEPENEAVLINIGFQGAGDLPAILSGTVATPTVSPSAGPIALGTSISLSCNTASATIYYTVDGSDPRSSATREVYSASLTYAAPMTLRAFACKEGSADSAVLDATYSTAKVAAPTFSPVAGAVASGTDVAISSDTASATIKYTTDGTDPRTSDTAVTYSAAVDITAATTFKAYASKTNYLDSDVVTAAYTISG